MSREFFSRVTRHVALTASLSGLLYLLEDSAPVTYAFALATLGAGLIGYCYKHHPSLPQKRAMS